MKKVLLLALTALAAALLIPTAFAGSAPAPKVTGDVTFVNAGYTQHWVFSAQDLGTAGVKGNVLDEWNGGTTISKIVSVHVVNAQTAQFTTEVTSSVNNPYALVGDQFHYTVHDMGEGANAQPDWFTYDGVMRDGTFYPASSLFTITSGNIQIH
jgi:hypothetical protein